ncbi:hypothetical protein CDD80_5034 [Ophiocordyceps camponoti-rufipedis]|uniref:Mid2 domain-containing protein n=1 Tax=Ophiocordyceps camponoti-rufipedis TaxID=2004952 RepID=A0A2C5YVG5_9HYPO|nr:hypothetical protein CDD80_5034 [Ophiocordyceps camponoti-rufipedis]
MHTKSNAVTVALALIGFVAAGPDPEQPRINEITRPTFNSTSSSSQALTGTANSFSTDPDVSSSGQRMLEGLLASLLRTDTQAFTTEGDDSLLTSVTDAPQETGTLPYSTTVKPGSTQRSELASHDSTQKPSTDRPASGSTSTSGPSSNEGPSDRSRPASSNTQASSSPDTTLQKPSPNKPEIASTQKLAVSNKGAFQGPSTGSPGSATTQKPASPSHDSPQGSTNSKPEQSPTSHHTARGSSSGSVYQPGTSSHDSAQRSSTVKPEPSSTSKRDTTRNSHLDLPSDVGIVIGPNGIVTSSPSATPTSRETSPDAHPPTTTPSAAPSTSENEIDVEPPVAGGKVGLRKGVKMPPTEKVVKQPVTNVGATLPTPPANGSSSEPAEPLASSSSSTKDGILAPVSHIASGLVPLPGAKTSSSAPAVVYSTSSVPVPTTKAEFPASTSNAAVPASSDVGQGRVIPIPSNRDVFSRPGGSGVGTPSASASSTAASVPTSVVAPIGKVAPMTSRTTRADPVGSTYSGVDASSVTSRPNSTEAETQTNGLLPVVTSKVPLLTPLVPAVNSILPGPANSTAPATLSSSTVVASSHLSDPTAISTSSLTDPTVPPPIAVSPTGTAPTAKTRLAVPSSSVSSSVRDTATETLISANSSSAYTAPPTASPTKSDGLTPLLSSLLSPTSVLSDLTLNTTLSIPSTAPSQSLPLTSNLLNTTTASTVVEVPVTSTPSTTSLETATSSLTTGLSSLPTTMPVTNATSSSDLSSQSTKAVLNTTTSAAPEITASSTASTTTELPLSTSVANTTDTTTKTSLYRLPPSSTHTTSSSSTLSSEDGSTTVESTISSHDPTAAVTTEHKASSTVVSQMPSSSSVSSTSQSSSEPPLPPPTSFPKYIAPSKPAASAPVGTRNITIALNNMVMKNGIDAISTYNIISRLLPTLISLSLASRSADKIVVFSLERCGASAQSFNFLARTSFPDDEAFVSQLQMNLGLPNSPIYTTTAPELTGLIDKNLKAAGQSMTATDTEAAMKLRENLDKFHNVTIEHCITKGTGQDANNGGDLGSNGNAPNAPNPGNQTEKDKLKTMVITMGMVAGAFVYGAAMFILARRYKRKRQTHRRSSSVSNSQESSEMAQPSPALMGGALANRDHFHGEGRDSRGSGRSGMANSGRTANISAPVAAENSLGWS